MLADAVRLKQILWNVIKNAVKFTPESGSIGVRTLRAPGSDRLLVRVRDTGIGMSPDELKRIVEPFSQGNHATQAAHKFGGLGLGLAISRELAKRHGGVIRATSEGQNRGTEFEIELPLLAPEASPGSATTTTYNAR